MLLRIGRLAPLLFLASGCVLLGARRNNQTLAQITTWKGTVSATAPEGKATFVVLLRQGPQKWEQQSSRLFYGAGTFEILSRPNETQTLFAFVDLNGDQTWQQGEPSVTSAARVLIEGEAADIGELAPVADGPPPPAPVSLAAGGVSEELVKVHRGDACTLGEPRFTEEAGKLGFWQPADFAQKYGIGVSMLEAYDGKKVPVLFVHGASGTPANFTHVVGELDRTAFTPWVYSYPSGLRLELMSTTLRRIVDDMQLRLGFERLIVVAHSMGGLVARGFVAQVSDRPDRHYVKLLVTISTPFGGHELAQSGVDHAPVVVPSWLDMATGSPFLIPLRKPLAVPHVMFFSYVGGSNGDGPTDGTVSLRSMLVPEIQDRAALVRGFPQNHDAILLDPRVDAALGLALHEAAAAK